MPSVTNAAVRDTLEMTVMSGLVYFLPLSWMKH